MALSCSAAKTKDYIEQEFENGTSLLQQLPSHSSMEWRPHSAGTPRTALTIGKSAENTVVAFLAKKEDRPTEVCFAMIFHDPKTSDSFGDLEIDHVESCDLAVPFKYIKGSSGEERRRFIDVIKWYFLARGLVHGKFAGADITLFNNFCKRLYQALLVNQWALSAAREKSTSGRERPKQRQPSFSKNTKTTPKYVHSTHIEHPRGQLGKRGTTTTTRTVGTMIELSTPTVLERPRKPADMEAFEKYLDSKGLLHLLENIPEVEEMYFSAQYFDSEGGKECLHVGFYGSEHIFAYLQRAQYGPTIHYFVRKKKDDVMLGRTITSKVALSQKLKHPFSKLCSPGAKYSDTAETTRLRTVAAWYLVASGTPLNTIFGNASDFYRRFQGTLSFIAKNMGAAAAIPPKKDMPAQLTQNERDLKSQRDELLRRNQEAVEDSETRSPTSASHLDTTDLSSSPLSSLEGSPKHLLKTRDGSTSLLSPPTYLVKGSKEYVKWTQSSLPLEERLQWDWEGHHATDHWRQREVGRWWYTPEATYIRLPANKQNIADHIGRIMESDLGERCEGDDACSACQKAGTECWRYSSMALEKEQVRYPGKACARCRAAGPVPGGCNLPQWKRGNPIAEAILSQSTSSVAQTRQSTPDAQDRFRIDTTPSTVPVITNRSASGNDDNISRGTKRKTEPLDSDEDTQFQSLALMVSEERTKTKQIKEWSSQLDRIDDRREQGIKDLDELLAREEERLRADYLKKCEDLKNRIAVEKQAFEEKIEQERDELLAKKEGVEAERDGMRKRIKLTGWGASE